MRSRFLKYRQWSRAEEYIGIVACVLVVSELVVFLLLAGESGAFLSKAAATVAANAFGSVSMGVSWIYRMVGPMLFPLVALATCEVRSVIRLEKFRRTGGGGDFAREYKTLGIVEGASPGFGFLGTCISLIFTMQRMDPNLSQSDMLEVLLNNASSAFGSTVFGISLALTAFLAKELFKGFLITTQANDRLQSKQKQVIPTEGALSV